MNPTQKQSDNRLAERSDDRKIGKQSDRTIESKSPTPQQIQAKLQKSKDSAVSNKQSRKQSDNRKAKRSENRTIEPAESKLVNTLANMKQFWIVFLFLSTGFLSFAQNPFIESMEISPQNPATNEEVFLITHTITGNLGEYLGSVVDVTGNTITVESCYFQGVLTQTDEYFDTISLGFFNAGSYNLNYVAFISLDLTNCDYQSSNSADTAFFVEGFADLNEADLHDISVFPNPSVEDDMITIQSESPIVKLELVDVHGKLIPISFTEQNGEYQFRLSGILSGVYFLSFQLDSNKRVVRRISVL